MSIFLDKGDIVSVNFNEAQLTLCHKAEIMYIPVALGDSWIFRDINTEALYYVSEGCTITRIMEI